LVFNQKYAGIVNLGDSLKQGSPTQCPRAPDRSQALRWSPAGLFWK